MIAEGNGAMRAFSWRLAALALAVGTAAVGGSGRAQTGHGGYDLGPDYGAMLNQMLQQQHRLQQQMQATEQQVVQQVMQDPRAQTMYQQHLAQGGQMAFPEFAWWYAATGGFTPEGTRRFQAGEAANRQREHDAWRGVQDAERRRAAAQGQHTEGYFQNQQEAGRVLQGQSSWIDPTDGRTLALPYIGPDPVYDPATGKTYARDDMGNHWVGTPDGYWYPMTPAR